MSDAIVFLLALASSAYVHAAEVAYPTRPVRIVVGYPPGGAADLIPRMLAPKLQEALGQPWIVDNRTGAGGNVALEIVARASPDGHTAIAVVGTQLTAVPLLYKLPISVEKDLQPVMMLATTDMMVIVHPTVPAKTLKELIALSKQKPGTLNFASAGNATIIHLTGELLRMRSGLNFVHVPYKGGGPASAAVLAGEAQLLIGTVTSAMPFIAQGKMRAIANTAAKRSKWLPDLPTVAESGYPGFESIIWYALLVPGATPRNIAGRMREEVLKTLQSPDVQTAMDRQALVIQPSTPAQLAAYAKKETETWRGVIEEAKIRVD